MIDEQEKHDIAQDNESCLADLESVDEVKGGFGQPVIFTAKVSNVSPAISGRESNLIYSGEPG